MRVVDTSAWIEALRGSPAGVRVRAELPDFDQWVIPTIVLFELAKWAVREKGEDAADTVEAYADNRVVADLDTAVALSAADLSTRHKLAAADAIVYATAQAYGADVLTCDRHFATLPGVHFIPKHDA
jgi:predicted nucleic acid-binding protein